MPTNTELAASLDAMELAHGGTVTDQHIATIRAVSDALKVPAPAPVATKSIPVPSKSTS